jgi:hypothetical protein
MCLGFGKLSVHQSAKLQIGLEMASFLLANTFPLLRGLWGECTRESRKMTVLTGGLGSIAADLYDQTFKEPISAAVGSQLIDSRMFNCIHYLSKPTKIAGTPSLRSTWGSRSRIHEGFSDTGYPIILTGYAEGRHEISLDG